MAEEFTPQPYKFLKALERATTTCMGLLCDSSRMKSYGPITVDNLRKFSRFRAQKRVAEGPKVSQISGSPGAVTLHGWGVNPPTLYFLKSP